MPAPGIMQNTTATHNFMGTFIPFYAMIPHMEMMPAAIAAQMAITQKNAALSMIKQTARMQQAIVDMIAESVPASGRGGIVNIAA